MKYFKFSAFIICVLFSATAYGQFMNPLLNSASNYNSGLADIDVVGTSSAIQSATFTNPARMFEKRMSTHLGFFNSNQYNFESPNYSGTFHYAFDKFAVGIFHKQSSTSVLFNGAFEQRTLSLSGVAGAYKISDKWQIGLNVNLFRQTLTGNVITPDTYLTTGLSTNYQDKKELSNNNEINWSFGAAINNIGAKQNGVFLPTQGKIGGTFGYLIALNPEKTSNVSFTFLYQTDKFLVPSDFNSDDSAIKGIFVSLFDPGNNLGDEFAETTQRFGLETFYTHKSSFTLGLRTATEVHILRSYNLFNIGLTTGYKGFYVSSGYYSIYNTIASSFYNNFGGEFGYQLDF